MVEVMSSGEQEEEEEDDEDDDEDEGEETEGGESYDAGGPSWDIDEDELHLDAARIYENTIVHLGKRLGDSLGNSVDGGDVAMSSTSSSMT